MSQNTSISSKPVGFIVYILFSKYSDEKYHNISEQDFGSNESDQLSRSEVPDHENFHSELLSKNTL